MVSKSQDNTGVFRANGFIANPAGNGFTQAVLVSVATIYLVYTFVPSVRNLHAR